MKNTLLKIVLSLTLLTSAAHADTCTGKDATKLTNGCLRGITVTVSGSEYPLCRYGGWDDVLTAKCDPGYEHLWFSAYALDDGDECAELDGKVVKILTASDEDDTTLAVEGVDCNKEAY